MCTSLVALSRRMSRLVQEQSVGIQTLDEICALLRDATQANVAFIEVGGALCASAFQSSHDPVFGITERAGQTYVDNRFNDELKNIVEIKMNVVLQDYFLNSALKADGNRHMSLLMPVRSAGRKIGVFTLYKNEDWTEEDAAAVELCATFCAMILHYSKSEKDNERIRAAEVVRSAINTLSYSELESVLHIFNELEGQEGLLVASKIADKAGITRSVIVNALRKFESAGVIESRSLGMKGTFIRVTNPVLIDEINKLRH